MGAQNTAFREKINELSRLNQIVEASVAFSDFPKTTLLEGRL